jgi:hypothetical protein
MIPRFFLALTLCLGWLGTAGSLHAQPAAPAATPGDSMLQQELKQQQIKATTRRVGEQLETIIADFDRNGIAGEDVKVLRAIRGVLGYLTEKDMEKVIAFLQQSRTTADPGASTRQATEAYAGQKAIVVQLQQLVLEYQRQQALYEISLRLKELATRQSANMWLGVGLAKSTENRPSFNSFDENQKISLRYQQSEQNPLKDEVAAIIKKLEKLSTEITDGPTAEKPRAALQQAKEGGLIPALESAAIELRDDNLKLLSAIGNEKKARDQMREIARMLILTTDVADALKGAIQDIDRAIDLEKKVIADTRTTTKREEAEKRSTEQAAVVDDTDLIRKDIDSLAPIAAEHLKSATDKMQEARSELASGGDTKRRIEKALPRQEEAVVQMQEARHALEEQLAKLEEMEIKPENNLVALKEIQEKVRELIKKEEALKEETAATNDKKALQSKAPKQGELKDQSQDLQAQAAAPSPLAAQALGEAASQMQKAQNSLAQQKNNPDAQQASVEALQKADQQLSQDISDLEKAQQDLAKVEEMQKKLAAIIEDQQKTQSETAKEAVKPEPSAEPTKKLAASQEKLGRDTGALQQEAEPLVPTAASHLDSASNHMDVAKSELAKPAAKPAQPKQTQALSELYVAKREFEKKADELREKLGLPPGDNTDALAEAQKRIEQAQKDVNDALQELQQAPPGLMEALQKQQKEIADALNEMKQDAPKSKPVAQAQESAEKASQELAMSDLPRAVESMKAAKSAMQQAQQEGGQPGQGQAGKPAQGEAGQTDSPSPALAKLGQQQTDVQKAAESMLASQKAAPKSAMQKAAQSLQNANNALGPLTSGALGQLPQGAQSQLEEAQAEAGEGSAEASEGKSGEAQQSASAAAQALAQAQAALSLAQAGVGSLAAMMKPGQGEQPGQQPGKGQGKGQGQGKGEAKGQAQGKGQPNPQGDGREGNFEGSGGADGQRNATAGSSAFTKLPARDRAALQQSQADKYPQEYGPLVEQYLRNLSDQSGQK